MKTLVLAIIFLVTSSAFAQNWEGNAQSEFFAQGMLNIPQDEMIALQNEMRLHPNLQVVRLDHNSNRFFILTANLSSVSESDLLSWFGEYAEHATCIQIGVHGVDVVNSFPFENCPN